MTRRSIVLCLLLVVASSPLTVAAAQDVVLHATDASSFTGMAVVADATAADGFKLSSPDNGWSSTDQPGSRLTAPTATFVFEAPAGNYRVWLRMKGKNNSKFNESVWVQFSSAFRNGSPAYRWGTDEGLLVNLENCSACGIQEWGWQDNAWWLNQSPVVTLPDGLQTLYVSVREDGVEFDQIVLSPARYLTTAPGPVKNDSRILARTGRERISIQQGSLVIAERTSNSLNVAGTNGFSFKGAVSLLETGRGALASCSVGIGCPPATETPFSFWAAGFEVFGRSFSYRGATYNIGVLDFSALILSLDGVVMMPPAPANEFELVTTTATFTFGERVIYEGSPGQPNGEALIAGGGTATLTFSWSTVDQGWYFQSANFQFVNPTGLTPTSGSQEILLEANDAVLLDGLSVVADTTAWGGKKISSENTGRQWPNTPPPPNTAPYAMFDVNVPETGDYRLWIRLKGQDNSKFNESVWVQFSDATRNGSPIYQYGSGSGLLVNLEDCSGCGIQDWGWQDNAWWLNQSSIVTLSQGTHRLYVTIREDGVEFDQIVLSPARYLADAPGPVKNDNTLVPEQ
jgi:hypothetical protein